MTSKVTAGGGSEHPQEEPAPPQVPRQQPAAGRAPVTRQDLPIAAAADRQAPPPESRSPETPFPQSGRSEPGSPESTQPEPPGQAESPPAAPQVPVPAPEPAPAPTPTAPTSPAQSAPPELAQNWHRYHFAIGAFLLAYGVAGLLGTLIGWTGRQKEIAGYLGDTIGLGAGAATPALITIKVVELLLTVIVLAGLLRRKDVWYLPALTGWIAGFAAFCALDLWAGRPGRLAEHVVYLVTFTVLLFVSYGLSVKVRVGRTAAPAAGRPAANAGLSRTQEIALAALNRWQRGAP